MEATRQYQDEEKEKVEDIEDAIINTLNKNLRKVKQIKMEQNYYKVCADVIVMFSSTVHSKIVVLSQILRFFLFDSVCKKPEVNKPLSRNENKSLGRFPT